MTLGTVLGLICIILGFVVGVTEENILFGAMEWLVAAIAFDLTLGGVSIPVGRNASG